MLGETQHFPFVLRMQSVILEVVLHFKFWRIAFDGSRFDIVSWSFRMSLCKMKVREVSLFSDILKMRVLIVEVALRTVGALQQTEIGLTYFHPT